MSNKLVRRIRAAVAAWFEQGTKDGPDQTGLWDGETDMVMGAIIPALHLVQRDCRECSASGTAEIIEGYARPCDACGGEGVLVCTATEAGLLDQCKAQTATITRLREAVVKARDKFQHYEQLHRLKCTAEGDEKADRNRELADAMSQALETTHG